MVFVNSVLLYGFHGTGKTLITRKTGGMLRSHPPNVVNGPEVLNKFVGESEANVRRLFAEAEEEEKRLGPASALHIIIFDEIDAICLTNRLDLIDETLMRPVRFEMKIEFGLPDEQGRLEILKIYTATMAESDRLATDVYLEELSKRTHGGCFITRSSTLDRDRRNL